MVIQQTVTGSKSTFMPYICDRALVKASNIIFICLMRELLSLNMRDRHEHNKDQKGDTLHFVLFAVKGSLHSDNKLTVKCWK